MSAPDRRAPDGVLAHRGFRAAVWAQCFGVQPQLALVRGLGLLYLLALGLPASSIVALLSASFLMRGLLSIPAGYWADRVGKKRLGMAGQFLTIAGFGLLTAAPWVGGGWPVIGVSALGIGLFGAGTALFGSGWFALLSPLLPLAYRGRYLGRMRFIRQLAAIGFGAGVALWMSAETSLTDFQLAFAGLTACLIVRLLFYRQIPELEVTASPRPGFAAAFREVLAVPGYRGFCFRVLLMFLAVGAVPIVFGLFELEVLGVGDDLVWWLGVAMTCGHLGGTLVAGSLVDRGGSRITLASCQGAFILSIALFLARGWGLPTNGWLLAASVLFGLARSTLNIGVTSELLARVPRVNKALAVSFCGTLTSLGESISGLLVAGALNHGFLEVLADGAGATRYDALLMGFVILLAVSLPLTLFSVSSQRQS